MAGTVKKPYTKPGMAKSISKIAAERKKRLEKQKPFPTKANKDKWDTENS